MSNSDSLLAQLKKEYPWIVKAKREGRTFFFNITLAHEGLRQSEIHQKLVKDLNGFFSVRTQPVGGLPLKKFNRDLREGFSFMLAIIDKNRTTLVVMSPKEGAVSE